MVGPAHMSPRGAMTLREWFDQSPGGPIPAQVCWALNYPWCHAEAAGRPPPKVGQALLVTAGRDERAALWCLTPREHATPVNTLTFGHWALDSLQQARALFSVGLPFLLRLRPLPSPDSWRADPIAGEATGTAQVLDERSFGAAMALAYGSLALGVPLPADFVVSAKLGDGDVTGGALRCVKGLDQKLAVVHDHALGVKRFFVAASQLDEAVHEKERLGAAFDVIGVSNLEELWRRVFSDPASIFADILLAAGGPANATRVLFFDILDPHNHVADWRCVERGAGQLAEAVPENTEVHWRATWVRSIASRHHRNDGELLWPDQAFLNSLRVDVRTRCIAQIVQHAADSAAPLLPKVIEKAEETFRDKLVHDRSGKTHELCGAVGRAWAVLGQHEKAIARLEETIAGFEEVPLLTSHALCERIRLAGVDHDRAALEAQAPRLENLLAADTTDPKRMSSKYVRLAWGRALILLGAPCEAKASLEAWASEAQEAPPFFQISWWRFVAAARRGCGDPSGADAALAAMEGLGVDDITIDLARLERALALGTPDVATHLEAATKRERLAMTLAGDGTDGAAAERLVRLYPY